MRLWHLRQVKKGGTFDITEMIIRAPTADESRNLAASLEGSQVWLDPKLSTVKQITVDGRAEVILHAFGFDES